MVACIPSFDNSYAAVSPALAREVVFRAFGSVKVPAEEVAPNPDALQRLLAELQAIVALEDTRQWHPSLAV